MNKFILSLTAFLLFVVHLNKAENISSSAVCFEPTYTVSYGIPGSDGVCCSGTQVSAINVTAYPDSPYGSNYGSISTSRNGNTGNVTVNWNGNWSGRLEFDAGYIQYNAAVFPLGGVCGGRCNTTTTHPHHYIITRYGPDFTPPSFIGCPANLEVKKGNSLTFGWNPTGGATFDSPPTYTLDYTTSISMPYSTTNMSIGEHRINSTVVLCGKTYTRECIFFVLPTCAYDNLSSVISGSSISGGIVKGGGYTSGGGYQVTSGTIFTINIAGLTDLWSNYRLVHNGGNDIDSIAPNQYRVKPSVTVGSYRFEFVKVNDPKPSCPTPPAFRIYVGGEDMVFESECTIILPDFLYEKGYPVNDPIIFEHFEWTVKSEQAIIIRDNGTSDNVITLVDGAQLKIVEVPEVIRDHDYDFYRNVVENTAYDDDGNVIASSRSYADRRGKVIQVQTKNISAGVVLASVNMNDALDRPSITSLAAPVTLRETGLNACGEIQLPWESLKYGYKSNFIMAAGDTIPFSYLNFDNAKLGNPDLLNNDTPGTLGWYYSDNNNKNSTSLFKEPLTAKTTYPYSQVEYKNDGTNQITSLVPQGDYYRSEENGHINKVVSKFEPILSNDPDVAKWLQMRGEISVTNPLSLVNNAVKNIAVDQHGVETYTIVDKSGKEIIFVHKSIDTLTQLVSKTYSFNFYDEVGRLKYSITPNGVAEFFKPTPVSFSLIDKTSYDYNHRGWILAITEPDAGRTEFKYRKDGLLRFSQNANQRAASPQLYSYAIYDAVNRLIESGEYSVEINGVTWSSINPAVLEERSSSGGFSGGNRSDIVKVYYDGENGLNTSPYPQTFVAGKISCTEKVGETKTWYSYDERGRLVWKAQSIPVLGTKKIEYIYAPSGEVKEIAFQPGIAGEEFYHIYEYDADTRLKNVFTSTTAPLYINGEVSNVSKQAEYFYYLHGPLKRTELADNLQGLDYLYTIEGWLKAINNYDKTKDPGGDVDDIFGLTLEYYSGDYTKYGVSINPLLGAGKDYFNGTIKASAWFTNKGSFSSANDPVAYAYSYDNKYQLLNAVWGNVISNSIIPLGNRLREGDITYDLNGNIKSIKRYDLNATPVLLHDFSYQYNNHKNQLESVFNNSGSINFSSYKYKENGQLRLQTKLGATSYISYNAAGKPISVTRDSVGNNAVIRSYYDDQGLKYKKETFNRNYDLLRTTWYLHSAAGTVSSIYQQDNLEQGSVPHLVESYVYGADRIGILYRNPDLYQYEIQDHIGNVRVLFGRNITNQLEVTAYTDYYPYGLGSRAGTGSNIYRFGYQGAFAEKDQATGWNEFELRSYDPIIGRWLGPDPYRQYYSGYVGMGNNPVSGIDPDGGFDSKFGAWLNKLFNGGNNIGFSERKGEWYVNRGYTDSDGESTIGPYFGKGKMFDFEVYGGATIKITSELKKNWKFRFKNIELPFGIGKDIPLGDLTMVVPYAGYQGSYSSRNGGTHGFVSPSQGYFNLNVKKFNKLDIRIAPANGMLNPNNIQGDWDPLARVLLTTYKKEYGKIGNISLLTTKGQMDFVSSNSSHLSVGYRGVAETYKLRGISVELAGGFRFHFNSPLE